MPALRVMFVSTPAVPHLFPMIPLAKAFMEAGHDVLMVTLPQVKRYVHEAGIPALVMESKEDIGALLAPGRPQANGSGDETNEQRRWRPWIHWSTVTAELLLAEFVPLARSFPPDLVVYEPTDLAGQAIADLMGAPAVMHNWGMPVLGRDETPVRAAAVDLRRRLRLSAEIGGPALVVEVCPPSFQGADYAPYPGYLPHERRQPMRYVPYNGGGPVPGWLGEPPRAPRVCLTAGLTVAGYSLALVKHTAAALKDAGLEVVIACRTEDVPALGDISSPSVKVAPWVPLNLVLPGCSAVIHHGGSGTTMTSLVGGVPQLVIPVMNDQFANAERVVATGVGRVLRRADFTAATVRDLVLELVEGDSCRAAAARMAVEGAARPSPAEVVAVLEEVAAAGAGDRAPQAGFRDAGGTGNSALPRPKPSLTTLAQRFHTDKADVHRYTGHYESHFARFADQAVNVLEIGIGGYERPDTGGASLLMWKSYFGQGNIFGLDIYDKSFIDQERIKTFVGDQTDEALLHKIVMEAGPLDVVIDDGSHQSPDVIKTFNVLFPLLAPDGIYVIEDTQTSYWPEWGGAVDIEAPGTTMALVKRLIDGLNYEEFVTEAYTPSYSDLNIVQITCYHNLVFIQKGENKDGTLKRSILADRYRGQ